MTKNKNIFLFSGFSKKKAKLNRKSFFLIYLLVVCVKKAIFLYNYLCSPINYKKEYQRQMDPKKILDFLQSEDLSTPSYNNLKNEDLYKILENFNSAHLEIINVLKTRDQKEEEVEFIELGGGEEEEEETELKSASMADIAPMSIIKDKFYVLRITVGKDHQGNANISREFMSAFLRRRTKYDVDYIIAKTGLDGIKGVVFLFDLDKGRTKHTSTHTNPEYYLSLDFFFYWIDSRKMSLRVNLNSHLRVVDEEGNDVDESEPKRQNIKGHFRSPRLEQYLVADFKVNKYELGMLTDKRRTKARLTPEREKFWKSQLEWFNILLIEYPEPQYFRAEEALRKMIKEGQKQQDEFWGVKKVTGTSVLQF